jgi:hypothetical protein
MRHRIASVASVLAYMSVAVVAVWELSTTDWDTESQVRAIADGRVHPQSVVLAAHLVCLSAWLVIAWRAVGHLRRNPQMLTSAPDADHQPRGVSGMLALACAGVLPTLSTPASLTPAALPVATLVLPSVAMVEVRRTRRCEPGTVAEVAGHADAPRERVWNPQVVVRVFGHPIVEGPGGTRAVFRKSRSLELLAWLCLNRDRQRRSTARTAIWEADIGDASFATVVSEMRRGLAEAVPGSDPQSWCPSSYTDEIALSESVVSDAELLEATLSDFVRSPDLHVRELTALVAGIRDMPFAGTGYVWPDSDGTTSRLMILGLDAVTRLADWAETRGDTATATAAITAGLRMMPGDAELIARQQRLIGRRPVASAPSSKRHRSRTVSQRSLV